MTLMETLREDNLDLYNDLLRIKRKSDEITKNKLHHSYTDHGIKHCNRIIIHLDNLLKNFMKTDKKLNSLEIFILLSAVFLHDIGMQLHEKSILKKFLPTAIITDSNLEDIVRKYHGTLSRQWIENNITSNTSLYLAYDCDPELGEIIARIVESHTINLSKQLSDYEDSYPIKTANIRISLIAILLSLGDSLDLNSERVNIDLLKSSNINEDSKLHWFKHYYISGVSCNNGIIKINLTLPTSLSSFESQTYFNFFQNDILDWINFNLNSFKTILHLNNIHIIIEDLKFKNSIAKKKLDTNLYKKIERLDIDLIKKIFHQNNIDLNIVPSKDINEIILEVKVNKSLKVFKLNLLDEKTLNKQIEDILKYNGGLK